MNAETVEIPNAADLLQLEQQLIAEGALFAAVTVIRAAPPTSTRVGAQAIVRADGTLHGWIGGGCAQAIVIEASRQCIRSGQPRRVRISNEPSAPDADVESHAMPCASNGALEVFIQPTVPAPLLVVFGGTPTAHEACVLARRVGLRACIASDTSTPGGPRFDPAALDQAGASFALIATQGDGDEDALEAALRSKATAVLLIASHRKAERLREAVRQRGVDSARFEALYAPAGPSIHANTPQEIALGAVAGVVALRHEWEAFVARSQVAAPQPHVAVESVSPLPPCEAIVSPDAGAQYQINPVCGMRVEIAKAKHVVVHAEHPVYFCCDGCKVEFERTPERYMAAM
jgi:xanthine dehydrogenase accessory factor